MSVQAGIWNFDGAPVEREVLTKISNQTAEYGPDGEEMLIDGYIGILYRPFHTTAESRVEHQPHTFADGKVMTWDGRLDNRACLLSQLGSSLPSNSSDLDIVASAFECWGADCFARITGDWALSLWNPRSRELILARDYIGVRHLYYRYGPSDILWSNLLLPLVSSAGQLRLCQEYIAGYLAADPEAYLTPFCEIKSVPPAHFVSITPKRISIQAYWSFNRHLRTRYKCDAEYEEQYRFLFRQAVSRRLRADTAILADLSGGFDSSSIVCMADDIVANE